MSLTMANGFDESIKTDLSQWNKIPHNKEQQPSKNQFVNKFIFLNFSLDLDFKSKLK